MPLAQPRQATDTFTITRTFDAPRDRVWDAWTKPEEFGQWFGPKGFTAKVKEHDLRPGGVLHSCLVSAEGYAMWAKFIYREIQPPEKLVWEHFFSDEQGGVTRHPGHATWPLKLITTVRLSETAGKTTITLTWVTLDATPEEQATFETGMASMHQGWTGTFDQLEAFLKNQ